MISSNMAETTTKALDLLIAKNPPKGVADAVMRLQRVVKTYAADDGAFNPVDFTESDLSEATRVFEAAARKDLSGYDTAARSAHASFRAGMNEAHDSKDRTKCRVTLIVDLAVAVAKSL